VPKPLYLKIRAPAGRTKGSRSSSNQMPAPAQKRTEHDRPKWSLS